jgi:phage terminase large subunit-like protein
VASKTSTLSCHRLGVIKKHLSDSPLPTLFPEILCKNPQKETMSKSSAYSNMVWKNNEVQVLRDSQQMECTIDTAGIGQYRTGWHYHRMYLDDLVDDDTVLSDVETENALRFEKLLIPMLIDEPRGIITQYGTRWGAGDLYDWINGRIEGIDDEEDTIDWDMIHREVVEDYETFCKYTPISKKEFAKRRTQKYSSDAEKAFIYDYYDDRKLDDKRVHLESDFFFYASYFNKIVGEDAFVFPPPFKEKPFGEFPKDLIYYMTVDPAFKVTKRSDFTACVVCGYNDGPTIYVAEALRFKGTVTDLLEKMYEFNSMYNLRVIGMEDGAWQTIYTWVLEHAQRQEGREKLPIMGLKLGNQIEAKDKRIRGLSYFFKCGKVVLKEGLKDLIRELGRYPGNTRSKDDLVDALSMQKELVGWHRNVVRESKEYVRPIQTYRDCFGASRKKESHYVRY